MRKKTMLILSVRRKISFAIFRFEVSFLFPCFLPLSHSFSSLARCLFSSSPSCLARAEWCWCWTQWTGACCHSQQPATARQGQNRPSKVARLEM